jgi:hypothetical protein
MPCLPNDYACIIAERIGTGTNTADAPASNWWKIAIGVAVLAVLYDVQPKLGGWLLLLIVLGLALSSRGRAIITGK